MTTAQPPLEKYDRPILDFFYKIGPVLQTSEGYRPFYATDLESWSRVTAHRFSPWVNETLLELSFEYFRESASKDKQPPWRPAVIDKNEAAKAIKAAFRMKG